jgi:hypothetical protein
MFYVVSYLPDKEEEPDVIEYMEAEFGTDRAPIEYCEAELGTQCCLSME